MKVLLSLFSMVLFQYGYGQVTLDADGSSDTYELITSVLAPNYEPIEVPDCNHLEFGDHIDQVFDPELNEYVFRFHIHTEPDNDRCIKFDRQRNEIKSYDKSPENLLGIEGEKVVYKWKFKLATGFQSSSNFTHIHQLKSVGGDLASIPMYTLTTRKGNPDRIELRYAETDDQETLAQVDLEGFVGSWVSVIETVEYGVEGSYEIEIRRVSDGGVLLDYENTSIVNWRQGADFVRPKWGIYRSLINAQDLRDEAVLFANFSIEELETVSSPELSKIEDSVMLFPNPVSTVLRLKDLDKKVDTLLIYDKNGRKFIAENTYGRSDYNIDISNIPNGTYVLKMKGIDYDQSRTITIVN